MEIAERFSFLFFFFFSNDDRVGQLTIMTVVVVLPTHSEGWGRGGTPR